MRYKVYDLLALTEFNKRSFAKLFVHSIIFYNNPIFLTILHTFILYPTQI